MEKMYDVWNHVVTILVERDPWTVLRIGGILVEKTILICLYTKFKIWTWYLWISTKYNTKELLYIYCVLICLYIKCRFGSYGCLKRTD